MTTRHEYLIFGRKFEYQEFFNLVGETPKSFKAKYKHFFYHGEGFGSIFSGINVFVDHEHHKFVYIGKIAKESGNFQRIDDNPTQLYNSSPTAIIKDIEGNFEALRSPLYAFEKRGNRKSSFGSRLLLKAEKCLNNLCSTEPKYKFHRFFHYNRDKW